DCDGDLRLGQAVGHPELHVGLRSAEKHHVPRHTLVVGTTGAGKSTFLAAWVEKLTRAGFCVVLLDVEGEYAAMNEPASSGRSRPARAGSCRRSRRAGWRRRGWTTPSCWCRPTPRRATRATPRCGGSR